MAKREEMRLMLGAACLGKNKAGHYVAKWSYFYKHGQSEDAKAAAVQAAFPHAVIHDRGDHWHAFVGGARTGGPQDSYLWVEFSL